MSCIKNGASIHFRNYGYTVRGDVYFLGDVYIFRWNTQSVDFAPGLVPVADYTVELVTDSASWWHRDDLGVTVVPSYLVSAWSR